jgi:DNA-binding transcriptional LysR family regulator
MNIISSGDDDMEVRQLEIFRALAEELHFTKAAARVHCVQSNVTTQIRALEDELGAPLFDRLAKRVTLTDAGRRFLPYVEKVLSTIDEAHRVAAQSSIPAGPLRIGAPESVLTYRLPEVLNRFRKLYPKVELSFLPYSEQGVTTSLETGKLDLAVWMKDIVEHERLKSLRLRTERVLFITDPGHPLAARKKVWPQDLSGQTLLLTEAGCAYRKKLDQTLALMNIRPGNITEFSSVEAIKGCASLGMGLALLPEVAVAAEMARNQLVALRWAGAKMDIATHVVWHKDKWISPAFDAFVSVLQEMLGAPEGRELDIARRRAVSNSVGKATAKNFGWSSSRRLPG